MMQAGIFFKLTTAALLVCCMGCSGGGDQVKLAPVSGVVTMDGKPLADVVVIFSPDKGNPSSGRTDSSGKYTLLFKENAKGALLGPHRISIITGGPVPTQNSDDDGGISQTLPIETFRGENDGVAAIKLPKDTFKKDPIPERYNTKSELKKEVVDGKNSFDFELTSK
ncbi:MAG: Ig-like domain-containing protein [Planctomycetaceae bacterium]|nr:Ig-like domain-containing protein [Planctomycetaceae bacterium]